MRILHLSDLHRVRTDIVAIEEQNQWIRSLFVNKYDAVVITGDIMESSEYYKRPQNFNPYKEISRIFHDDPDLPIICTLGNHEFYFMTVQDTLDYYAKTYRPKKYNVHYLDVTGHYDIGDVRFMGNVLWYDGSLITVPGQDIGDFAGGRWMDRHIRDFDWMKENEKCRKQIMDNRSDDKKNVLCTHCVPHSKLNMWMEPGQFNSLDDGNIFNAFSGVADFLTECDPDYALCGHTHRRVNVQLGRAYGYNVGNDLVPPFLHYEVEI